MKYPAANNRSLTLERWPFPTRMRRRARRSKERGQALLEFAVLLVLILFMIAGVVDVGGLLNDHINIEYATRQAARTGAVLGNQPTADCAIISAINAAIASVPSATVTQIIIYEAGADGQPQGTGSETIYAGDPTCSINSGTPTLSELPSPNNYPSSVRNNNPYTEDSLGIQVTYQYTFQFPLLGSGVFQGSDYTVMPMNPIVLPTPNQAPTPTIG
jgi:Flp pilus assembly protein TadG